jgi:hypothetical protein
MIRSEWVLVLFMFGFVSASSIGSVCVDLDEPSAPGNLSVSGEVGEILVEWDASVDEPSCSGVDYYVVLRGNETLGNTSGLSFVDVEDLGEGSYTYYVYAVDLVGGNAGASVVNEVVISGGYVGGGSSSGSWTCSPLWVCGNWSDCVGNDMRRICEDENNCKTDFLRPEEYMSCGDEVVGNESEVLNVEDSEEGKDGFVSVVTGAVIGGGAGSVAVASGLLAASGFGLFFVVKRRRNKMKVLS